MFYWWILRWSQSSVIFFSLWKSSLIQNSCTPCSSGTYSLEDPYNISACHKCPDDMKCLGSDIYFPVEGYWRISATSDNIVQCFNSEACLYFLIFWFQINFFIRGGQQDSDRDVSLTGFCGAGYHGVACGSCDPGYAKFGSKVLFPLKNLNPLYSESKMCELFKECRILHQIYSLPCYSNSHHYFCNQVTFFIPIFIYHFQEHILINQIQMLKISNLLLLKLHLWRLSLILFKSWIWLLSSILGGPTKYSFFLFIFTPTNLRSMISWKQ